MKLIWHMYFWWMEFFDCGKWWWGILALPLTNKQIPKILQFIPNSSNTYTNNVSILAFEFMGLCRRSALMAVSYTPSQLFFRSLPSSYTLLPFQSHWALSEDRRRRLFYHCHYQKKKLPHLTLDYLCICVCRLRGIPTNLYD